MSNNDRKTSKLAIAGLIISVAAPCMFLIGVLTFTILNKYLGGFLDGLMLTFLILPFIALPLSITGVVISKTKDRKVFIPGSVGIILSAVEVILVIITLVGYSHDESTPGHSLDIIPPHIGASVAETSGSPDRMGPSTSGTKPLTLDDVNELSSKGDELVWEDLTEFSGYETGSGLYIVQYNIDDNYELVVGGTSGTGKPMYAYLVYEDGTQIDIRTEDVEAFISEHS